MVVIPTGTSKIIFIGTDSRFSIKFMSYYILDSKFVSKKFRRPSVINLIGGELVAFCEFVASRSPDGLRIKKRRTEKLFIFYRENPSNSPSLISVFRAPIL